MLAVLVAAAIVAVLYFAREVIVPIILAVLLSFLLAPAVRWLRRLRLGRLAAVGLTVLVAFFGYSRLRRHRSRGSFFPRAAAA